MQLQTYLFKRQAFRQL